MDGRERRLWVKGIAQSPPVGIPHSSDRSLVASNDIKDVDPAVSRGAAKECSPEREGLLPNSFRARVSSPFRDPCRGRLLLPFGSGGGAPKALATG